MNSKQLSSIINDDNVIIVTDEDDLRTIALKKEIQHTKDMIAVKTLARYITEEQMKEHQSDKYDMSISGRKKKRKVKTNLTPKKKCRKRR